jgi:Skp family chaperone for outer membrane proteins
MRKMALMLTALAFTLSAVPAFSQMSPEQKNECLLASKNCTNQVDDIYKRIHKLAREIKKGTRVYTPAELKKLQDKLQETQKLLDDMTEKGGS